MTIRLHRWLMTAVFAAVAGVASAQSADLLKYDIEMKSALQINSSTYVMPPGQYRLEQFDDTTPNLFILRQKDMDGSLSEPLAILDAWRVPYFEAGMEQTGVKLVTDPEAGGVAVLTGWQIGEAYWRLRDVAALDAEHFMVR